MATKALDFGPALREVLAAQDEDDEAVSYTKLQCYGAALARLCSELGDPIVWPVGPAAERVAGAATILSHGDVRVRGWTTDMTSARVLLLTVTAATALPLADAAGRARALGAAEVFGCGVRVHGVGASSKFLDSYVELAQAGQASR